MESKNNIGILKVGGGKIIKRVTNDRTSIALNAPTAARSATEQSGWFTVLAAHLPASRHSSHFYHQLLVVW